MLYVKEMNVYLTYTSKHNLNHENQVILLMIPNGEGWHYLEVKKSSTLLRSVTSKNNSDFYCLNCLYPSEQKTNLNHIKKYARIKVFAVL